MNIENVYEVLQLSKDKKTLERLIASRYQNSKCELISKDCNGAKFEFRVRQSTLTTFLQVELKEIDKKLKSLGVTL